MRTNYRVKKYGYIDGFSRRLIWLEVGPPNKNSEVIGKYYFDAILQIGGVSQKMRSVNGTENSIVEALQIFLRSQHTDEHSGLAGFSFGTSTSNQRIVAYLTWSHLIKDGPGWWVNFLKDLRDFDLYNDLILFKSILYDFVLWTYSEMNYTKLLKCEINMYKP